MRPFAPPTNGATVDAVDWTAPSVLAGLVLGAVGYLSRQMHTRFDQVDARIDRVDARIDRLDERYVRHLEAHAGGSAPSSLAGGDVRAAATAATNAGP